MADIQRPNRDEEHDAISKSPGATGDGGDDNNVEQELRSDQKKQLIVKFKYQHPNSGASQSANESSNPTPDSNLHQKSQPIDNSEKPARSDSPPHNRETSVEPQVGDTTPNEDPDAKSSQAPNETVQHIGRGTTVPREPLIEPRSEPRPPNFTKQEPGSSEVLEGAHEEPLLMSNALDSRVNNEDNAMHVSDKTDPLGSSSDPATRQVSRVKHEEKVQGDGAREESGRDDSLHESEPVEDLLSTNLEQIVDRVEKPESFIAAKDGDKLEGAPLQHGCVGDDTHEEPDQNPPATNMLEQQSGAEEEQPSGDDTLSGKSESEGSENEDIEDEEEDDTQEEDEMPHRGRMPSRAHSQALTSALNDAEVWELRLAHLQEKMNRTKAVAQLQNGLQPNTLPLGTVDGYQQQGITRHSHQLLGTYHPHDPSMATDVSMQNQNYFSQQRQQYEQNFHTGQQRGHQVPPDFRSGQQNLPGPSQMSAMNYPGGTQDGYQYGRLPQQNMGFQHPGYSSAPFGQMLSGHPHAPYPPQTYDFSGPTSMLFAQNHWPSHGQDTLAHHTDEYDIADGPEEQLSDDDSDDDEPLRERVKRHSSNLSHGSDIDNSPPRASAKQHESDDEGHLSDVELLTSTPRPKSSHANNPVRMQRPLPQPTQAPEDGVSPTSSGSGIGSWKLPTFEVQRQPKENEDDGPLVKVSIPNLVREELLLSPDHADQEVHLLLNIFVPGQQALATPDPEPAVAVLNFHTIALMVVEAFVQFEIGDEFGQGRGHWHGKYGQGDEEYERMRNAKDANVDDIFFAIIDRWRTGLESKKKNLELIRGVQEFCDVALDVIYYIKEHGLLSNEPEPKSRAERSDKGKKRGSGKDQEEESDGVEAGKGKGKKRGAAQDVNVVQARKKAKTEKAPAAKAKSKAKPKAKKTSKTKVPGITVIVNKKRG